MRLPRLFRKPPAPKLPATPLYVVTVTRPGSAPLSLGFTQFSRVAVMCCQAPANETVAVAPACLWPYKPYRLHPMPHRVAPVRL